MAEYMKNTRSITFSRISGILWAVSFFRAMIFSQNGSNGNGHSNGSHGNGNGGNGNGGNGGGGNGG